MCTGIHVSALIIVEACALKEVVREQTSAMLCAPMGIHAASDWVQTHPKLMSTAAHQPRTSPAAAYRDNRPLHCQRCVVLQSNGRTRFEGLSESKLEMDANPEACARLPSAPHAILALAGLERVACRSHRPLAAALSLCMRPSKGASLVCSGRASPLFEECFRRRSCRH